MSKANQRVALSKRLLKEGLMELLKKKTIHEISVKELCEVSEINRTTFYRHYQTPHDVLLEVEYDFMKGFQNPPAPFNDIADLKKHATRMCSYLFESRDLVKLFLQNNTDSDIPLIFQNSMDGFLTSRKVLYRGKDMNADAFRLLQTFYAHGGYALIRQWIIDDIPLTTEEIVDLLIGLANQNFSII